MSVEHFTQALPEYLSAIKASGTEASIRHRCLEFLGDCLGITLLEANGPFTRASLRYGQVEYHSSDPQVMGSHWARTAALSEIQADRYYRREALRYFRQHPFDVAGTAAFKLFLSGLGFRPGTPALTPRNVIGVVSSLLVVVLAAIGLRSVILRGASRWREAFGIFTCLGITTVLILCVGPVGLRYRLNLDGIFWILSAVALVMAGERFHVRRRTASVHLASG